MSDPVHIQRSRLARTVKSHGRGSPEALAAKRDLVAANLERAVRQAVAEAPPLTNEQAQRIVALLMTGGVA